MKKHTYTLRQATYLVECHTDSGPVTRKGGAVMENVTENQIELTCLIKAFQRLTKPCSIRVFTRCEHVLNSMNNRWVYQWEKNSWRKQGNKPVKNAELWQQLLNVMRIHTVTFSNEHHSYTLWQQSELKQMEEKNSGKV